MENAFNKDNTEGFDASELYRLNVVFDSVWALYDEEYKTEDGRKNLADDILSRAEKLIAMFDQ